jgi:DNA-binding XRE family transcriptional regulator
MYGDQNGKAKLSERQVRSIRRQYRKGGITQKALARYYGVGETTIYYICTGERWINLPDNKKAY